jgi:hypothetical protein
MELPIFTLSSDLGHGQKEPLIVSEKVSTNRFNFKEILNDCESNIVQGEIPEKQGHIVQHRLH